MGDVRLVDLEIIKRYSLAIRQETVPAEELLAVLDASRDAVLAAANGSINGKKRSSRTPAPAKKPARASSRKAAR